MSDKEILRELTREYVDIAAMDIQQERRDLWRKHNSFQFTRPLIYARAFAWREMPQSECECADPYFRMFENRLRTELFRSTFNDDYVFEPWISVGAALKYSGWGVPIERHHPDEPGGAWKAEYVIKDPEDMQKLVTPKHEIDEEQTRIQFERISEAIGDLITLDLDRSPAWKNFSADISTMLGYLRGIENFMMDMYDKPEWFKQLLAFMSEGIQKAHQEAEDAGDWSLANHQNQAIPYAGELQDPAPNVHGVKRSQLWTFCAAQEYTCVSPEMHDEFLLQYQLPIIDKFGLASYGCCEDLTHKIDMLRQIPNLRRIAVAPVADVRKCAEQIGSDYLLSYRPSPADMVSYDFDPARIRRILREDFEACKGCCFDITLKDVETVERDPDRVRTWVKIVREVIDEVFV